MKRRRLAGGLIGALAGLACLPPAHGVERRVRLLCAVPVGGPPDRLARQLASHLAIPGAGPMVVENRPGGGGIIAVAALQQAAGDPNTLLLGHSGLVTMLPFVHPRLPYDPAADLVPVSVIAETGFGLAVGPAVPPEVTSVAAFAGWARAHPREANIAYAGVATPLHVLAVLLPREAHFIAQAVGYPGGPQVLVDLLGGRVAAAVLPEGLLRPLHEDGRLRVIATAGPTRSEVLPGVPSFAEQGLTALVMRDWFGLFMASGAAPERVQVISTAARTALARPDLVDGLRADGWLPVGGTSEAMRSRIAAERPWWRDRLMSAGVQVG